MPDFVVKMVSPNRTPGVPAGSMLDAEFEIKARDAEAAIACAKDFSKDGFVWHLSTKKPKSLPQS